MGCKEFIDTLVGWFPFVAFVLVTLMAFLLLNL